MKNVFGEKVRKSQGIFLDFFIDGINVNISFNCFPWQQEENLLDVLQLVLSIMTEQPDTCIPVFDKVDGLR